MCAARLLDFAELAGWSADDHAAALSVYASTVDLLGPDWPRPTQGGARTFFEREFTPVQTCTTPGLLTGYYEPELEGRSRKESGFTCPLYAPPPDLATIQPWHSRAMIDAGELLAGLELVWLADPVDVYFAQVQGSVRIRMPDGRIRRFGFAAKNGHDYRSIGQELSRRGVAASGVMTVNTIRDWCRRYPDEVPALFHHNPSFVFFREVDLGEAAGPSGSMGRPVTAMRSLAVDSDHIPLGAPVWVEGKAISTLMVAQDTGSAIKGPQRGDIFCGTGTLAADRAGNMQISGRLVTLFPVALAESLVE